MRTAQVPVTGRTTHCWLKVNSSRDEQVSGGQMSPGKQTCCWGSYLETSPTWIISFSGHFEEKTAINASWQHALEAHLWTKKESTFTRPSVRGRLQDYFVMGWQYKEEREIWIADQKKSVQ